MTIHKDSYKFQSPIRCIISNRFSFGVPLEDIFPQSDIHPQLKNLLESILRNYNKEDHRLSRILKYKQGNDVEQTNLVEKLELCKAIDEFHIGTLFWGLKHFLECLPVVLLPFYTNGEFFHWFSIVKSSQSFSIDRRTKHKYMLKLIIENLLRLPSPNLMLLDYFITFLRRLISPTESKQSKFNRYTMIILVKYYGLALFEKRFPFVRKAEERQYFPLLYYIIYNWHIINYLLSQKKHSPVKIKERSRTNFFESVNKDIQTFEKQKDPLETIFDNEILQFGSPLLKNISLSGSSPEKSSQSNFELVHSECQTDPFENEKTKVNLVDASTQIDSDLENDLYFTPLKEETKKSNSYEEIRSKTSSQKPVHSIEDKLHCLQSSENSHLTEIDEPYIYDDYAEQMLITTISNDSLDLNDEDIFLSLDNTKMEKAVKSPQDIKSKMAKLGWTYTPSEDKNDNCPSDVNIFSPRPYEKKDKNLQGYQICYDNEGSDVRDVINVEEKVEGASSRSLKGVLSMRNMRIKLAFLRTIGRKRHLIQVKANSSDELISKIKYEKMDSARSTVF